MSSEYTPIQSPWIAPPGAALPDFIICGAMKSGTSTLHAVLSTHPSIYIPSGEPAFFDIDDPFQHCDFNTFQGGQWYTQALEHDPKKFWDWYARFFSASQPGQLLGEDSTTYLASRKAIQRIALQEKPIKLVVMLRQPSERAYSQYWHMLRSGLVGYTFEQTIQYCPEAVLQRSLYLEQLQVCYEHFPKDRIKVVLFEEFVANRRKVLEDVAQFLDIDVQQFPGAAMRAHENPALVPRYIRLYQWKNRMIRGLSSVFPRDNLPVNPPVNSSNRVAALRLVHRLFRRMNPLLPARPPEMAAATKAFLDDYFQRELRGLDELIGQDVSTRWFGGRTSSVAKKLNPEGL